MLLPVPLACLLSIQRRRTRSSSLFRRHQSSISRAHPFFQLHDPNIWLVCDLHPSVLLILPAKLDHRHRRSKSPLPQFYTLEIVQKRNSLQTWYHPSQSLRTPSPPSSVPFHDPFRTTHDTVIVPHESSGIPWIPQLFSNDASRACACAESPPEERPQDELRD